MSCSTGLTRGFAQGKEAVKRTKKIRRLLVLLGMMHGVILFAGFFAPNDPETQNREFPFAPPVRLHFNDEAGFHIRPVIYSWAPREGHPGEYLEDRSRAYPVRFFVPGEPYRIAEILPARLHLIGVESRARITLFGTDAYGRDLFSRSLYGGQISLLAGWLATALALLIGVLLGGIAGFFGGWTDEILMRAAELFLALPWLYLLLAVRAVLPLGISTAGTFLLLIGVIGTVGWARPARLVRGVVLSGRERDYVRAARGFGASSTYLLRRHILPQTSGVVRTQAALLVPQYILAEVTLSFLGLGVGEPVASWGTLLAALQQYHVLVSYWWMFLPGLVLVLFFLGYSALADALGEGVQQQTL